MRGKMAMSTRDRIVKSAAEVMRAKGVTSATTREIAREAGCSEALLYKHFASKQELFVAVLRERLPRLPDLDDLVGTRTVVENLVELVEALLEFYVESFPMAATIFGSPALREAHRASVSQLGAGPEGPALLVQAYLEAEVRAGRLPQDLPARTLARALTGAALFEAFQAAYAGQVAIAEAGMLARRIVESFETGLGCR
ncbi:TetR/AcrR family transcriptional regulator [Actinoalloteichus hymeniacidonis]|uniref:Transcriptional regulator, TetR family n=1 Tax=Actinoalloteichus hymeniacidonis TaxID=340345 RepID=A0AAC9MWN8_9PSEU|nr:TetR/AcrR family transcriptional regulator [Actinoalloteichus hymeniacidonis]AOS61515.1 transcriptional regulator, TetR family [Actinoalloteichus hymeniacidonis]MBB5910477.1 AcrR family transcriptional regulator [Actinoalloteichus hymeniacidonis]